MEPLLPGLVLYIRNRYRDAAEAFLELFVVGVFVPRNVEELVAIFVFVIIDRKIFKIFRFAEVFVYRLVDGVTAAGGGAVGHFEFYFSVGASGKVECRFRFLDGYGVCLVANFEGLVCLGAFDNLNAVVFNASGDAAS